MTTGNTHLHDILRRACAINAAHITGDEDEETALLVALHDRHGLDGVKIAMRFIEVFNEAIARAGDIPDPDKVTFAIIR